MVILIIARNYQEIFDKLDFTDSIIEEIRWENALLDLILVVDYFYEEYKNKLLKIRFYDCLKSNFSLTNNLLTIPVEEKKAYSMSWHTIQFYEQLTESEQLKNYKDNSLCHFQIYTTDRDSAWLSIICKGVTVELD